MSSPKVQIRKVVGDCKVESTDLRLNIHIYIYGDLKAKIIYRLIPVSSILVIRVEAVGG